MPKGVALPQLEAVRKRQLLTQDELATRAGVSRKTVSRIERAEGAALYSVARKLAEALGVEPTALMAREG